MKKLVLVLSLIPLLALGWHGTWNFQESCTEEGLIDVTATYDDSDDLGGTVEYTSNHTDLEVGDEVTVELEEDSGQHSSYTVTNTEDCSTKIEICHNGHTILVDEDGWSGHDAHEDDTEGACEEETVDVCPNIEGDQETVPEGKELVDGQCVDETTPPEDLCDNIEGTQEVVPEGMEEHDGVCATPETPDEDDNDGGSSGGSSHHRSRGGSSSGSQVCVLPGLVTGFDVQNAVVGDGKNELVWDVPFHVVAANTFYNPFTGEEIDAPVGTTIYPEGKVNIYWGQSNGVWTGGQVSENDGFEVIGGLPIGVHHWFIAQHENQCGAGPWGGAVDPLN